MLYTYNINLIKDAVNKIFMADINRRVARPHHTDIVTMIHSMTVRSADKGGTICLVFCNEELDKELGTKLGELNKIKLKMPDYIKEYIKLSDDKAAEAIAEGYATVDLAPMYKAYYTIAPNSMLKLPYRCGLKSRMGDMLLASADVDGISLSVSAEHINEYGGLNYDSHDIEDSTDHNGYSEHHFTQYIVQE